MQFGHPALRIVDTLAGGIYARRTMNLSTLVIVTIIVLL